MADRAETRYQEFKWEVLGDAVDECPLGVWEPLWEAKRVLADLPEPEREAYAERALRELFDEGLIFFFRIVPWESPELAMESGRQPLDRAEVEAIISGSSWRSVPLDDSSTWFAGTITGEQTVREHWPGTATPTDQAYLLHRIKPDMA